MANHAPIGKSLVRIPRANPLCVPNLAPGLGLNSTLYHTILKAVKNHAPRTKKIDSLIVKTPGVLGGRPRIRGHRIAVHRIAGWWQLGLSIEEIAEKHPSLNPAEIHAALAYYHLHRPVIDRYLSEERATAPIEDVTAD
jgi:uncharacterized protein (DUF433 family)